MALPDFFVVGAPKAGTTALHRALARHPQLFMSPVKEPKFFLCEGPPPNQGGPGDAHSYREWIWQPAEYERLFSGAPAGALRGESTPFYLADRRALERIHMSVPGARLIAILRDPVDRAYSNWAHLWADGLETVDTFMAACAEEPRRIEAGWAPFWRYLETGLYGRQLADLYSVFPREQVLVLRYKWLVEEPGRTLDAVCRFLGVDEGVLDEAPALNVGTYVPPTPTTRLLQGAMRGGAAVGRLFPPQVWRKASIPLLWLIQRTPQHRPELPPHDRARVMSYFADDIALVEELTGWDLAQWRTYREGGTYSVRRSWAPSRRLAS
ncbi:MAG TPA: sulfotransferase [Acidimicrobiales bacterium]|nr:sulfotransferase [Acidimicrobiales bacterium]